MAVKKHTNGRTATIYGAYVFRNKDPIIDKTRTIVQDSGLSYKQIEEKGGPKAGTLKGWFKGPVKRPSFCCVEAVGRVCGYTLEWTDYKR